MCNNSNSTLTATTVRLAERFAGRQRRALPLLITRIPKEPKLYGTIPGLILAHVVYSLPITTLIFRNYFAGIPTEMVEAARVDGAGVFKIFTHVVLPLSIPSFVVVGIFQFTNMMWSPLSARDQ